MQGSGRSDGEWVTLGAHEVDDLEVAVSYLRARYPDSAIALWGRSMGAVTCLLYGHRDPSIAGMVGFSAALGHAMRWNVGSEAFTIMATHMLSTHDGRQELSSERPLVPFFHLSSCD